LQCIFADFYVKASLSIFFNVVRVFWVDVNNSLANRPTFT